MRFEELLVLVGSYVLFAIFFITEVVRLQHARYLPIVRYIKLTAATFGCGASLMLAVGMPFPISITPFAVIAVWGAQNTLIETLARRRMRRMESQMFWPFRTAIVIGMLGIALQLLDMRGMSVRPYEWNEAEAIARVSWFCIAAIMAASIVYVYSVRDQLVEGYHSPTNTPQQTFAALTALGCSVIALGRLDYNASASALLLLVAGVSAAYAITARYSAIRSDWDRLLPWTPVLAVIAIAEGAVLLLLALIYTY